MSKQYLVKILNSVLVAILAVTIFIVPVYFNWRGWNIFELDKAVIGCWLIELLLIVWLIKNLWLDSVNLVWQGQAMLVIAIFLFTQVLAAIFSISPHLSFWGSYWREQGLWLIMHYLLFFWLALQIFLIDKKRYWLKAIIGSVALVIIYAWCQLAGLDVVAWSEAPSITWRVFSTFGQPNFLGLFLLLTWPLVWYQTRQSLKPSRWLLRLLLVGQFSALFFTFSRTIWLGLLGQIIILVGYWLSQKKFYRWLLVLVSGLILLSLGYGFLVWQYSGQVIQTVARPGFTENLQTRWQTLFNWQYGSLASRWLFWQAAASKLPKLPAWGYGQETQSLVLADTYIPQIALHEKINTIPDRTHNETLDVLLTSGYLGLLAWLAVLGLIVFLAWLNLKTTIDPLNQFLFLALAGYLLANQFNFTTVVSGLYFWLFIALLAAPVAQIKIYQIKLSVWFKIFLVVVLALMLVWFTLFNYQRLAAEQNFAQAKFWERVGGYQKMIKAYERVFALNSGEGYYRWQLAQSLQNFLNPNLTSEQKQQVIDLGFNNLQQIDYLWLEPEALLKLAQWQVLAGYYLKPDYFLAAEQTFKALVKLSPQMARLPAEWGKLYLFWQKYDLAEQQIKQALALYPPLIDWRVNEEHRRLIAQEQALAYQDLGQVYFQQKKIALAKSSFWQAYHLSLDPQILKILVEITHQIGPKTEALSIVLHLIKLQPEQVQWYQWAGLLYNEMGKPVLAQQYLLLAKNLNIK
ncbi:MAG: O-antigen ligase family protein [Candidatus Buchananbacteria bacterium]